MKLADVFKVAKSVKMEDANRFVRHVVPEVVRPARIIWNQAIGGIFVLFAVVFLGYAYNYYRQMETDPSRSVPFGFSLFLGSVMAFFGIASFLKARSIGRPRVPGRR